MKSEEIYEILHYGSPEERQNLIQNCPENTYKDLVIPLIGSDKPGTVVAGMTQLITQYCSGKNPSEGAPLALATHNYALKLFKSEQDYGLLSITLSSIAYQYVNALSLLGRPHDVIRFTEKYIPYYETIGEIENLISLKIARINALLDMIQIEEAERLLKDPSLRGNWVTDIEILRVEKKLKRIKNSIAKTRNNSEKAEHNNDYAMESFSISNDFKRFNSDDQVLIADLNGVTTKSDPLTCIDPTSKEGFKALMDLLYKGHKRYAPPDTEENELTIKKKLHKANSIFMFEDPPPLDKIKKSLSTLEYCHQWATQHTSSECENDALWGIYLCYSRMDKPSLAADALLQLRENLEKLRACISDPAKRDAIFSTYPKLFDCLCEKLYLAGRADELLEAIEASKGRGISDILTIKLGSAIADKSIYGAVNIIPELTRRENFHYVTYHNTDEYVYVILVSNQGDIHMPQPIHISKSTIREAVHYVDPLFWSEPFDYDPSVIIDDISKLLSPLVQFLEPCMDTGIISAGDHICYSPDEDFQTIPLSYLMFSEKHLTETFSLSGIHNAYHLKHVLNSEAVTRPSYFLSVIVPTQQNLLKKNWDKVSQSFLEPTQYLQQYINGRVLQNENVSIETLKQLNFHNTIIQFFTHGVISNTEKNESPFYDSGLVISNGHELPDEKEVDRGHHADVLTPSKVLDLGLQFNHSHLSVLACVSGLSPGEGGSTSLGMEWAFIQAGAASILSTHWYIRPILASKFLIRFYDHWLVEKKSRCEAYRQTIDEFRNMEGELSHPFCWAAFSLTGDWR